MTVFYFGEKIDEYTTGQKKNEELLIQNYWMVSSINLLSWMRVPIFWSAKPQPAVRR